MSNSTEGRPARDESSVGPHREVWTSYPDVPAGLRTKTPVSAGKDSPLLPLPPVLHLLPIPVLLPLPPVVLHVLPPPVLHLPPPVLHLLLPPVLQGDWRAALTGALAHHHFGGSYKWLLQGDDDTVGAACCPWVNTALTLDQAGAEPGLGLGSGWGWGLDPAAPLGPVPHTTMWPRL